MAKGQITIWLRADKSEAEAKRLLAEGGEVRDTAVLRRIAALIPEGSPRVVFKRVDGGKVREFKSRQAVRAIQQRIEIRPDEDESAR